MQKEQYVCTVCGFNMVGYYPDFCLFCGAPKGKFITSAECSARYKVMGTPVNKKVTRLNSVPPLGFEHAAYRIETGGKAFWVDCPSCFDKSLQPADVITFTHHHFLGASNQYRDLFHAPVRIHKLDSAHSICLAFTFDATFTENFVELGIEAFHAGGHTPGFTFYLFEDVLLICDYVFPEGNGMRFNPFGPQKETRECAATINTVLQGRGLSKVCGWNYVVDYKDWKERFDNLLSKG
ncbi:MAG: MBL fold metallo-hydrolase [Candidatus Brocadia sp. WS118]|nr:MAG: MBL fold metallo-hydrolase [Candidatus Brocadia sp. WS118]